MKVSIVMATYNGAEYLGEQLESFVNQKRSPEELVVCDDSSTDKTYKILEEFKRSAPFDVVLVKNEHRLGFTKNFEKALANCSGDIIFFSDQDDKWFPSKVTIH